MNPCIQCGKQTLDTETNIPSLCQKCLDNLTPWIYQCPGCFKVIEETDHIDVYCQECWEKERQRIFDVVISMG